MKSAAVSSGLCFFSAAAVTCADKTAPPRAKRVNATARLRVNNLFLLEYESLPEHNEATIPSRTPKSPKVDFSIFGDFKIQFAAVAVECAASRVVYKTAQLIRAMGTVEVGYVSNNDYGFAHDQASVDDANQIGDNTGKAATELSAVATQLDP